MNAPQKCTVPLAQAETNQCHLTPRWFVDKSEYDPLAGSFQLLTNGENAFREVHRAIEGAEHSVNIICWGFQPSMYFIRDEAAPCIGELLERKAIAGKIVRVLCYVVDIFYKPIGVTGWKPGEANAPGRRGIAIKDRPPTHTDDQFRYDLAWYGRYNKDWGNENFDRAVKLIRGVYETLPRTKNLAFVGRGFSPMDRIHLARMEHADHELSMLAKATMAATPSHHQKMVLIDYEDKERCLGFLMGHNMLDEYWDTDEHSYVRAKEPNKGRNGSRPRHDFSSRLTGPIVGDLYRNFAQAWKKETGHALSPADFASYPAAVDKQNTLIMGQILRTHSQERVANIKTCYLQAVANATQYIHIENQYFRWPPLAEKVKECAIGQTMAGRKPEVHGPLYVFVITNADSEGMGAGVRNTYRMLESLGRADTLPEVTRQLRPDDVSARLTQTRQQITCLEQEQRILAPANRPAILGKSIASASQAKARYAANEEKLQALREQEKKLSDQLKAAEESKRAQEDKDGKGRHKAIAPEEVPGLKIHICTLVSPDSPGRSGSTATNDGDRALTREERIEAVKKRMKELEGRRQSLLAQRRDLDEQARMLQGLPNTAGNITERYAAIDRQMEPIQALEKELKDLQDGSSSVDWTDVYIHAKLMLIDDAFMTLGSANINSRSMEVDSELNIAHHRPEVTLEARKTLWNRHTNGNGGSEPLGKAGMRDAHKAWGHVISNNKSARKKDGAPIASLIEFYSGTKSRADLD